MPKVTFEFKLRIDNDEFEHSVERDYSLRQLLTIEPHRQFEQLIHDVEEYLHKREFKEKCRSLGIRNKVQDKYYARWLAEKANACD